MRWSIRCTPFVLMVAAGCGLQLSGTGSDAGSSIDAGGSAATSSGSATNAQDSGSEISEAPDSGTPSTDSGTDSGPPPPPPEPPTTLSPSTSGGSLTYQAPIDWTIAALDPTAFIYYTTDGSTPTTASSKATGAVTLNALANGTHIQWTAGESKNLHSFTANTQSSLSGSFQAAVDHVTLGGGSTPYVHAAPGSTVQGSAKYVVFSQSSCPGCIDQVMVGITKSEDCIYDNEPGAFPGANGTGTFAVTAPTTPGSYPVKIGLIQDFQCKPDSIGSTLSATVIGTIVVP